MFKAQKNTILITEGDSGSFDLRFWDDEDKTVPRDLSTKSIRLVVSPSPGQKKIIEIQAQITDNIAGFVFLPAMTKKKAGEYVYDIEIQDTLDPTQIETIKLNDDGSPGTFMIVPEVAQ